jgi:NAD(P)-dependent dehydrogenase (short-subunit alcohol dehydrogenase family)
VRRPIVVTGARSGIGAATAAMLRNTNYPVLGVDLSGTDVAADLSNAAGRNAMVAEIAAQAPDGLAAVIAAAGTANKDDPAAIVSVNYFGVVSTLELLRPLLAGAQFPRAVLVASIATLLPFSQEVFDACIRGGEEEARAAAVASPENTYAATKRALAIWMRRAAVSERWAGAGILLNGVAPGAVRTAMTAPLFETSEGRQVLRQVTPIAVADYAEPADIADVLIFLSTMASTYVVGQLLFVDGGTEALMRPDLI